MTFALLGLALVAALSLAGWVMAELDVRDAHHENELLQQIIDDARVLDATVTSPRPTLHAIDGGNS